MEPGDQDRPIEERVGEQLERRGEAVATAESFTGGLVGNLLTEVPGASEYFDRAVVTYTHEAKMDELAVQREVLDRIGAVNEIVAEQMARGVRDTSQAQWGVSTTGVAGPETPDSAGPVGTAYISIAHEPAGDEQGMYTVTSEYHFDGDRSAVKERGARRALADLYGQLSGGHAPDSRS
ncbi:MAG: CinA family protein [Haloarculaceae archaeon]